MHLYVIDQMWRVIYIMPALFAFIQFFLILCVYKEEPLLYSIQNGHYAEARAMAKKLFRAPEHLKDREDELINSYVKHMEGHVEQGSNVGLWESLTGRKYRRATWVSLFVNFVTQLGGIHAVNIHANRLIE